MNLYTTICNKYYLYVYMRVTKSFLSDCGIPEKKTTKNQN